MRIRTSRERRILRFKTVTRWILYYVLIIFSFTLMTSGTFLKPVLLLPLALAIAIGNDADKSVLTRFAGDVNNVLFAEDAVDIADRFQKFTMSISTRAASKTPNVVTMSNNTKSDNNTRKDVSTDDEYI